MGIYTLGSRFCVTLHTILCGNYGFRDICILDVVLLVTQNIMQCGSLCRSDNSLSYSLGLNFEIFDSDGQIGHDSSDLHEDGTSTDIHGETSRNSYVLELCAVMVVMNL